MRSRTGNDLQMDITYHDKNGRVVTERKYDKLIPSFKGRIDTALSPGADWSPWSKLYLQPGEPFASPSPRQYAELEVALISERPDVGVALDWLRIEFGDPVAQEVVGEIFPVEVQPGERTEFAYYIRPQQVAGRGFDHLEVETSAPIDVCGDVLVEGEVVAAVDEPTWIEDWRSPWPRGGSACGFSILRDGWCGCGKRRAKPVVGLGSGTAGGVGVRR